MIKECFIPFKVFSPRAKIRSASESRTHNDYFGTIPSASVGVINSVREKNKCNFGIEEA